KIPGLTVLFYTSDRRHDSEGMINIMCELTPSELRAVVSDTCLLLIQDRTGDVELRVDDYDRVVLFDGQANQGVAMAASGAYQRFSRFYDGSFRYGIELLFNAALKSSLDSLFRGVCGPAI